MWRNWQTRRLQVPVGFLPVEVRLLSSAVLKEIENENLKRNFPDHSVFFFSPRPEMPFGLSYPQITQLFNANRAKRPIINLVVAI